jgi:hypothetical protein
MPFWCHSLFPFPHPSLYFPQQPLIIYNLHLVIPYFHQSCPSQSTPNSTPTALILRIAGLHFPGIKTCNECAILRWLATHTQIPLPKVLRYDATRNNELGYEYMLMSMVNGHSFQAISKELPRLEYQDHLEGFLDQIVDVVSELASHSRNHVGGLQEITGNVEDGEGTKDAENRSMIVPDQL